MWRGQLDIRFFNLDTLGTESVTSRDQSNVRSQSIRLLLNPFHGFLIRSQYPTYVHTLSRDSPFQAGERLFIIIYLDVGITLRKRVLISLMRTPTSFNIRYLHRRVFLFFFDKLKGRKSHYVLFILRHIFRSDDLKNGRRKSSIFTHRGLRIAPRS